MLPIAITWRRTDTFTSARKSYSSPLYMTIHPKKQLCQVCLCNWRWACRILPDFRPGIWTWVTFPTIFLGFMSWFSHQIKLRELIVFFMMALPMCFHFKKNLSSSKRATDAYLLWWFVILLAGHWNTEMKCTHLWNPKIPDWQAEGLTGRVLWWGSRRAAGREAEARMNGVRRNVRHDFLFIQTTWTGSRKVEKNAVRVHHC